MSQKSTPNYCTELLSVCTILAMAIFFVESVDFKETKLSFYVQDISSGPNLTEIPVAGIAGKLWTFTQFGTIFVSDNPLTEGPDPKSPSVGRIEGLYATSSLDGYNTHVLFSVVFTNKEYNGSTIEVQGNSNQFEDVREYGVVSGTRKFRFVRGYANFETLSFDVATFYSLLRLNLTLHQYKY